jgi:hypothetical protein
VKGQEGGEVREAEVPSIRQGEAAHASNRDETTKTLEVLLANGWEVTKWQRERIDSRDRLAVQILAFAGVILALMPNLLAPLDGLPQSRRAIVIVLAAISACVLIVATILALVAVAKPPRRRPNSDRLVFAQRLWPEVRDRGVPAEEALRKLMDELIGVPGDERPFLELAATADRREWITRLSAAMMGIGVVLMVPVLVSLVL